MQSGVMKSEHNRTTSRLKDNESIADEDFKLKQSIVEGKELASSSELHE